MSCNYDVGHHFNAWFSSWKIKNIYFKTFKILLFQFSKKGVPKPSTSKDVADDSDEEEEDDVIEVESDATGKESPEEKTPKMKTPKKTKLQMTQILKF